MKINELEEKLVDSCRDKLMEHFDSVRIFVTRHDSESGNTAGFTTGGGNFFAQIGQIREWDQRQDQFVREDAKKDCSEE